MKKFLIKKKNKKFKIEVKNNLLKNNKIILVTGPLGTINFEYIGQIDVRNNKFFIEKKLLTFFIERIKNSIKSVTVGWFKELNLNGLGFKAFWLNDKIALDLGYSNLILYKPNLNVKIKNFKNKLILFSLYKNYLGDVCNQLKKFSKPDSYKGKGILFKNEVIKLKKKTKS